MFNSKGQEAAPFELLIAVIVMTFVIMIGLTAMNVLLTKECEGRIDSQMEELKTDIEKVAGGEGKESSYFEMPGCFSEKDSKLEIVDRDDRRICTYYCGSGEQCTLLVFTNPNYHNAVCLRISSATVFLAGDPCDTSKLVEGTTEYCIDQWKAEPIKPGRYILIREFSLYTDTPVVCVYRVKQGVVC